MSALLGASLPTNYIEAHDTRALSTYFKRPAELVVLRDNGQVGDYRSTHWPGAGGLMGDAGDVMLPLGNDWYAEPDMTKGSMSRFGVVGVTRDIYGSPIGGVTVTLYRTSDDSVQAKVVSDALGNYTVTTPFAPDSHYIVMYKAGSPDVFGTTQNTLVGA